MISKLGKRALCRPLKQKFELDVLKLSLRVRPAESLFRRGWKIRNSLFLEHKIEVNIAPVDVLAGMPNNLFAHVCRHFRVSQRGNETVAKAVKTKRFTTAFALLFGSKWSSNTCQVHQTAKCVA